MPQEVIGKRENERQTERERMKEREIMREREGHQLT
jgi:hypothetical protein